MMRVMAIDPGLAGGLAILCDGQPFAQYVMPLAKLGQAKKKVVDLARIQSILLGDQIDLVLIERQWRDGMCNQCKLEALCQLIDLPYELISSTTWQQVIPPDIKKAFKNTKQRSIETCHRLGLPVPATGSALGWHDGLADAWCLAHYYANKGDYDGSSKRKTKRSK